jgi:hypothetical protein
LTACDRKSRPTQLANAERHAERRGWKVVARFKDDGYSAFKEIRRDDFVNLIGVIEQDEVDVVIVRDIDRLTAPTANRKDISARTQCDASHDAKVKLPRGLLVAACRTPLCWLVGEIKYSGTREIGIEVLVYPGWLLSLSAPQPCQPSIAIRALTRPRSRRGYGLPV